MSETFQIVWNAVLSIIGLVAIVWFFIRTFKRTEDPAKLLLKIAITVPFVVFCMVTAAHMGPAGPGIVVFMAVIVSIMWTPHIAAIISKPFASLYDGGDQEVEPKPYYSIALSKRKLNKPLEAIVAAREQLAKFPNDYEGVTLLANIQAEDMKDLPGAEITLDNFCNSPGVPDKQVAAAWTQMADWHLKLTQDSDSARASLEKIIAKFPDTGLSLAAAQRIAHLDGTVKQLLAPHDRHAMFVPEGVKNPGLRASMADLAPVEADPEKTAADFVKQLEQHPHDTEAREKLAIIYAHHYKRLDLAALELNQLIEQPNQPHKRVAHWLNLLADLQIHGGADYETVFATLSKIVALFPDLPVAELARARLNHLKLEFKGQSKAPENKTLGVYEKNIGLKYGPTYGSPR